MPVLGLLGSGAVFDAFGQCIRTGYGIPAHRRLSILRLIRCSSDNDACSSSLCETRNAEGCCIESQAWATPRWVTCMRNMGRLSLHSAVHC